MVRRERSDMVLYQQSLLTPWFGSIIVKILFIFKWVNKLSSDFEFFHEFGTFNTEFKHVNDFTVKSSGHYESVGPLFWTAAKHE